LKFVVCVVLARFSNGVLLNLKQLVVTFSFRFLWKTIVGNLWSH
jgi:hypothetical protein